MGKDILDKILKDLRKGETQAYNPDSFAEAEPQPEPAQPENPEMPAKPWESETPTKTEKPWESEQKKEIVVGMCGQDVNKCRPQYAEGHQLAEGEYRCIACLINPGYKTPENYPQADYSLGKQE